LKTRAKSEKKFEKLLKKMLDSPPPGFEFHRPNQPRQRKQGGKRRACPKTGRRPPFFFLSSASPREAPNRAAQMNHEDVLADRVSRQNPECSQSRNGFSPVTHSSNSVVCYSDERRAPDR